MESEYIVVGIGETGQTVSEKVSAVNGSDNSIKACQFQKFTDFRKEDILSSKGTKAIFLVLRLGDFWGDEFISELDAFVSESMAPVYAIVSYPFLWEGYKRIGLADSLLEELIRICTQTFRIESHQWFPLKEQLGFHGVVDLLGDVAAEALVVIVELLSVNSNMTKLERIVIYEDVESNRQSEGYWIVVRKID